MGRILSNKPRQRGSAMVLFSVVLVFVLLPIVGLAIDSGIAYVIKTKLAAAVDAAALAGARSLSIGETADQQQTAVVNTMQAYFSANFPPGLLNAQASIMPNPNPISEPSTHVRTVSIQGTAQSPLYFLSIFGQRQLTVAASAQAARRDVNVVMVLDRSGSMAASGVCTTMKSSATNFVNMFSNGRDRLSLITFKGSGNVDFPNKALGQDSLYFQPTIVNTISQLQCAANTGSAQALTLAHQQFLDSSGNLLYPGALNVVLFFTDGQPNGVAAYFPIATGSRCTPNTGTIEGFISDGGSGNGVYSTSPTPISDTSEALTKTPKGCSFQPNSAGNVAKDVAYIGTQQLAPQPPPDQSSIAYALTALIPGTWQDEYGDVISPGYKKLPIYPATIPVTSANSDATSWNAADYAASRLRQDGIVIYCIGESKSVDSVFLKRVANTLDSTSYNPSQQTGLYVYSPDGGQLASAFQTIASQILRISQ